MHAKGALLVGICYNPTPTPCNEIGRMGGGVGGVVLELVPMHEGFVQTVSSELFVMVAHYCQQECRAENLVCCLQGQGHIEEGLIQLNL